MKKGTKETSAEVGRYLLDLSKLLFGGVILTGIMKTKYVTYINLYVLGTIAMCVMAITGFVLIHNSKKANNNKKK